MEYMDIEMIKLLIKEIEDYIKRVKTFATWFIGVTVTFAILFIAFIIQIHYRKFDVFFYPRTIHMFITTKAIPLTCFEQS